MTALDDLAADFPSVGVARPRNINPILDAKRRAALHLLRRLTVAEVAARLGVSESTVYVWRRAGKVVP